MKKFLSTKYSENSFGLAMLILRIAAGGLLLTHGYTKLQNFGKFSAQFMDPFHIGAPASLGLVIFAELFCSVFIVLGLFTRLAAIPPIIAMAIAAFKAHKGDVTGAGEMSTLFLAMFIVFLFVGAGKFSMDKAIGK